MLMKLLILLKLVETRKIENDLLILEWARRHFFIGQKVVAKTRSDIVIIIIKKNFLLVQFLSEFAKLK